MTDIHNYKQKLEKVMKNIKNVNSSRINSKEKELLREFYNYCFSTNLSAPRIYKYMMSLWKITEWKRKDFNQMGKGEIQNLVSEINQKHYSPHTKKDYRITLKKFFQWLDGDPDSKKYPDKVNWISTTLQYNGKRLPEDILSKDDVREMIKKARNPRDKAFISALYESGCRIGEFLPLKWKHLDFTPKYGLKMRVEGKTGTRKILLVASKKHLAKWKSEYPKEVNGRNRVWVNIGNKNFGKELQYRSVNKMLKRVAGYCGIEKNVNPHAFRHARATHLANHLTEAQLCEYFGWVQGSKQSSTYVHLSGRDVDNAIKRLHGLEEKQEEELDKFDIRKCRKCGKENGPEANVCKNCGYEFGKSMEDRLMELIKENPEKWGSIFLDALKQSRGVVNENNPRGNRSD